MLTREQIDRLRKKWDGQTFTTDHAGDLSALLDMAEAALLLGDGLEYDARLPGYSIHMSQVARYRIVSDLVRNKEEPPRG